MYIYIYIRIKYRDHRCKGKIMIFDDIDLKIIWVYTAKKEKHPMMLQDGPIWIDEITG